MRVAADNYKLFANLIEDSRNAVILMDKEQKSDVLTAALFFEGVLAAKGKKAQIVSKQTLPENLSNQKDKFVSKIEPPKLLISFNWHRNQVDKVAYDVEGENFNFIVTPKDKKIKPEEISFAYRGKEIDLVIALGLKSLHELEEYEREYLENKTILNIDTKSDNQMYGNVNIVNENADSICAVITQALEKSGFTPDPYQAEVLLSGLREATNGFSNVKDSYTFEAAAYCTKIQKGELKKGTKQPINNTQVPNDWLSPKVFRSNREAS